MPTPFTPGVLTAAQARQLNDLMRIAEQFARLTVSPPLSLDRAAGIPSIRLTGTILDHLTLPWKHVVRAASTANGTLASAFENGDTLDGVTLATGDRILLKNQTAGAENGIYIVNPSGAPTRATDADDGFELLGAIVWVSEGTTNADSIWACTTNAPITVGTTATVWVKVYPSGVASWKEPVRAATTAAGTLATSFENGDTIDGVTLATGDRILIKNQAAVAENGIYTVNASGAPTRATDADDGSELVGATVWVNIGTVNADTIWACTTNPPITLETSLIIWIQVFPSLEVEAVDGSPSVSGVLSLTFDEADGFIVSTPGTGTARIDQSPASATTVGYVTTGSQTFAGAKTFNDTIIVNNGTTGIQMITGTSIQFDASGGWVVSVADAGFHADLGVGVGFFINAGGGAGPSSGLVFVDDASADDFAWVLYGGTGTLQGCFAITDGTTLNKGITDTRTVKDGSGNNKVVTITGGIITDWET